MKEYKVDSDDFMDLVEGGMEEKVNILKKLEVGEFLVVDRMNLAIGNDTTRFNRYIEQLRETGLDVGRGDVEYGFKMPLPEKNDAFRKLIVFRRK